MRGLGIGFLLALLALFSAVSPTLATASLDPVAMKRLLYELGIESRDLTRRVQRFLVKANRWEPADSDRVLWDRITEFQEAAEHIGRSYRREAYPGMEGDVRKLLETGRQLGSVVEASKLNRRVRADWERVLEMQYRLADAYGWNYETGTFAVAKTALPSQPSGRFDLGIDGDVGYTSDDRSLLDVDLYADRIADGRDASARDFSVSDDRTVGSALTQLDHLIRAVDSRLTTRRSTEQVLTKLRSDPVGETAPASGGINLEADLAALGSAATDAQRQFAMTRRASEVRPEVTMLLRLAHKVDASLVQSDPSSDIQSSWSTVVEELNLLAVTFDYPTIATP